MQPGPTDEALEYIEAVRQSEHQAEAERKVQKVVARTVKPARKKKANAPAGAMTPEKQGGKRPFGVSLPSDACIPPLIRNCGMQLLSNATRLMVSASHVRVADHSQCVV